MGTATKTKPFISGFCNPTLPRTDEYDPHSQCRGCACEADDCHLSPRASVYDELLAGVLALRAQADRLNEATVAANCTRWEEAVQVLHHLRLARATAQVTEEALTKWIATAWREVGIRDPQEVEGIGVIDVRRGKERKAWDHEGLGPAVIDANLQLAGGEIPDPFTVARWVLAAAAPSYWRTTALKAIGIDPDEWCESKPGRVSVQITTHDHIGATA